MRLKSIFALALIPQILLVNFIKNNPSIIDDYYSYYLYNNILKINLEEYPVVNQLILLGEQNKSYEKEIKKLILKKIL